MKNLILLITILLSALQTIACSSGKRTDNLAQKANQEYMVSATYYRGGWFAAPGQPNWSHDLTIDFSKYTSTGFEVDSEVTNPNCTRTGSLSLTQTNSMANLISQLQLLKATAPPVPDAGIEYVEIELKSGTTNRYYLQLNSTPTNSLYAINPEALRSFMQALDASLVQTCK